MQSDPKSDILRAWTERLYAEYDNICFHYRIRLNPPVIRIKQLGRKWGEWSPITRTISLSNELIERHSWDIVLEILKHEMAHQLAQERLAQLGTTPHGHQFQRACDMLGVATWARTASGDLPEAIPSWREKLLSDEEERLLKRAEKLLALSSSGNEHEAALAMQMVQQLYAKYNLERLAKERSDELVYCVIDRQTKRIDAAQSMLFSILGEFFFVRVVYSSRYDAKAREDYKVVELLGTRENVLIAEYVYFYLDRELESLWREFRRKGVRGLSKKRSYLMGVLAGFRRKLAEAPASQSGEAAAVDHGKPSRMSALQSLDDARLSAFVTARFPKLASRRWRSGRGDASSYNEGIKDGSSIKLRQGLSSESTQRSTSTLRLGGG